MANLLLAVPYGLGAGGVDAALNNCVAIHYASRHMNWLRCMWGIGASAAGQCAMVVVSGDVVQANPEFAPSRWVYAVAGILGVACVEAAMVPLWNLLTLVDRLDVFSGRAVRWVDAIIACAAVEAAPVLFVTLYGGLAHAEYRDPASGAYVDVALGAPGVVPAGRGRPAAARGVRAADAGHALAAAGRHRPARRAGGGDLTWRSE